MKKLSWIDYLALGFICFTTALTLVRWNIFYPMFIDIYYHLTIMRSFDIAGGLVMHDFLQYAPVGRPHIYAPLVHVLMLLFYKLGFSVEFIGRFFSWIMFPLSQLAVWFSLREIFNEKTGFYALVLVSAPLNWVINQGVHNANAIPLVLAPLVLCTVEKDKIKTAIVLLTACLYSHAGAGVVPGAALIFYGLHRWSKLRNVFVVIAVSLLLFSPWLTHTIGNLDSVKESSTSKVEEDFLQLHRMTVYLILIPLMLAGLVLCYIKRKEYLMLPAYLYGNLVMFLVGYSGRFWAYNSYLPYAMLGSVALALVHEKIELMPSKKQLAAVFAVSILLVVSLVNPAIGGGGPPGGKGERMMPPGQPPIQQPLIQFEDTMIVSYLRGDPTQQASSELTPENLQVMEVIEENSGLDDIVFTDNHMYNPLIASITGRGVTGGLLAEVQPEERIDPPKVALIHVFERNYFDRRQEAKDDGFMAPKPVFGEGFKVQPCGDGVCDEHEQANPQLCPQDCTGTAVKREQDMDIESNTPEFLELVGTVGDKLIYKQMDEDNTEKISVPDAVVSSWKLFLLLLLGLVVIALDYIEVPGLWVKATLTVSVILFMAFMSPLYASGVRDYMSPEKTVDDYSSIDEKVRQLQEKIMYTHTQGSDVSKLVKLKQRAMKEIRNNNLEAAEAILDQALGITDGAFPAGKQEMPAPDKPGLQQTPSQKPGQQPYCGDGVCDDKEQANPNLCPQDCQ